jgi:hypothetical protein
MGRRTRLAAVILGIGLSLVYWVAGQDMGQFWSGITTDPNTAPLLMLLGVTVLGAAPWRQPGPAAACRRNSDAGLRALVSMTAKVAGGIATVSCWIATSGLDAASTPVPR